MKESVVKVSSYTAILQSLSLQRYTCKTANCKYLDLHNHMSEAHFTSAL